LVEFAGRYEKGGNDTGAIKLNLRGLGLLLAKNPSTLFLTDD
jgi:hypothetical protein